MGNNSMKTTQQVAPDLFRNVVCLCGITIPIQHKCPEDHFPMFTRQLENALPVELSASSIDHVRKVRAIEALAARDKQLRSYQFFRSQHSGLYSLNGGWSGPFDPGIFDYDGGVAHARDEIDKKAIPMGFEQPHWITHFAFETLISKVVKSDRRIFRRQKQIEVLGVAANAGVLAKGKCSRHGKGDALLLQQFKDLAKQGLLLLGNSNWSRRGFRYSMLLRRFRHETLDVKRVSAVVASSADATRHTPSFPVNLAYPHAMKAADSSCADLDEANLILMGAERFLAVGALVSLGAVKLR